MNASGSKPQSRTSSFLRAMGHRASDNGTGGLQIPEAGVKRRPSFVESFLGRSRKKSLVPEVKPPESEGSQSRSSLIADGRASSVSASDSTVTPTSHSFGSMVAARLSPSKHKFRLSRSGSGKGKAKASADAAPVTGYTSDSQLDRASRYHRRMSSERSHPVPHRPTITVSASPDTFDDLFTKPINPIPPTHTPSTSISSLPQSRRKWTGPGDATSGDESEALSTLSLPSRTYSSRRLRRGQGPSNIPSLPPSAPLPAPPTAWSPPNVPVAKPRPRAESPSTSSLSRRSSRPRSLTLSSSASVPPSPTTPRPPSPPPEPRESSTLERKSKEGKGENEALDIYTASIDQLRQALISRNLQMEELASYLLKVTQNHVTEKNALEKRIASLEKEAARRDKEMNSLKWLVGNGRAQGTSASTISLSSSGSRSSSVAPTPIVFPPSRAAFPNRGHDHNDSETSRTDSVSVRESTDLSGAESSSSSRLEKMKTLSKAAPRSRIASIRFQPMTIEAPLSDTASGSRSGQGQRSSISSFTSSGASSTSSNVPSNPPNATMPLTSIPEATGGTPPPTPPTPPQGPPPPPTHTSSSTPALPAPPARIPKLSSTRDRDPAIVAAISTHRREKEKGQRSTKAQPPSAPARTPAAAYAANLQKNRPSIGQIMNTKSNS